MTSYMEKAEKVGTKVDQGKRGTVVESPEITVKPFNLAALKVGDFACKIILVPFILVISSRTIPTHE